LDEAADEDEKAAPPKDDSIDRVYPFCGRQEYLRGGFKSQNFPSWRKNQKRNDAASCYWIKIRETTVHWKKVRVPEPNTFPEAAANPHLPRRLTRR
jgi:hypothetical protein